MTRPPILSQPRRKPLRVRLDYFLPPDADAPLAAAELWLWYATAVIGAVVVAALIVAGKV
jgi:hypothetical protein